MEVHGSCHCGAITYRAEADPENVYICHCTDCQKLSGSAFRVSALIPNSKFQLLTGEPRQYLKRADSGAIRRHMFCPNCGSPLYACPHVENPEMLSVRVGCMDERRQLMPKRQAWCQSALEWVGNIGQIPGRPGQ